MATNSGQHVHTLICNKQWFYYELLLLLCHKSCSSYSVLSHKCYKLKQLCWQQQNMTVQNCLFGHALTGINSHKDGSHMTLVQQCTHWSVAVAIQCIMLTEYINTWQMWLNAGPASYCEPAYTAILLAVTNQWITINNLSMLVSTLIILTGCTAYKCDKLSVAPDWG